MSNFSDFMQNAETQGQNSLTERSDDVTISVEQVTKKAGVMSREHEFPKKASDSAGSEKRIFFIG